MRSSALPSTASAKVSLLLPCYDAHAFVEQAIRSALNQSHDNLEIIVSPDDGQSYDGLLSQFNTHKLKVLPSSSHVRTGAGAARNRAIDAATGDFFAMLDADDVISPHYISDLLQLAGEHGAAVAPSRYIDWNQNSIVREPFIPNDTINLENFSKTLASIHPLIHRSMEIGYCDGFAQDVIHDGWVFAALGSVPIARSSSYDIRLRQGSTCNGAQTEAKIQSAYAQRVEQITHKPTSLHMQSLSRDDRHRFAQLFRFRAYVSQAFAASGANSYNAWLSNQEQMLWEKFSNNGAENAIYIDQA
jgi:glycosyltransferase involved in cell wall biosynthesis